MKEFIRNSLRILGISYIVFAFSFNVLADNYLILPEVQMGDLVIKDSVVVGFSGLWNQEVYQCYNYSVNTLIRQNGVQQGVDICRSIGTEGSLENVIKKRTESLLHLKDSSQYDHEYDKKIEKYKKYLQYTDIVEGQKTKYSPIDKDKTSENTVAEGFRKEVFSKIATNPQAVLELFTLKAEQILINSQKIFSFLPGATKGSFGVSQDMSSFQTLESQVSNQISELSVEFSFIEGLDLGNYSDQQIKIIAEKMFVYLSGFYGANWEEYVEKDTGMGKLKNILYVGIFYLNRALLGINVTKVVYFPVLEKLDNITELSEFLPKKDKNFNNQRYLYVEDCINLARGQSLFQEEETCRPRDFYKKIKSYMESYEKLLKASVPEIVFLYFYKYSKIILNDIIVNLELNSDMDKEALKAEIKTTIDKIIANSNKPDFVKDLDSNVVKSFDEWISSYLKNDVSSEEDSSFFKNVIDFYLKANSSSDMYQGSLFDILNDPYQSLNSKLYTFYKEKLTVLDREYVGDFFIRDLGKIFDFQYYKSLKNLRDLFIKNVINKFFVNANITIDTKVIDKYSETLWDTEEVKTELRKINNNLNIIVPEELKKVSPLKDEDCDEKINYWTKSIITLFPSDVVRNEKGESMGVGFLNNESSFFNSANSASPITKLNIENSTEVISSDSFKKFSHDFTSLKNKSLYYAISPVYSNYIQLSELLTEVGKTYNDIKFRVIPSPVDASWEAIKKASIKAFWTNLTKEGEKADFGEKGRDAWLKYKKDENGTEVVESMDTNKESRRKEALNRYILNLSIARNKLKEIDQEIQEIEKNGKNLQKIVERKGLNKIPKNEKSKEKIALEKLVKALKIKIDGVNINIPERMYNYDPFAPASWIVNLYDGYESITDALEKALQNYMHKAYPTKEDFKREWEIRQNATGDSFTREEILYAWFCYLIKSDGSFFTKKDDLNNFKKGSNYINSEIYQNKEKYIYDVFAHEGLLIPFLVLDFGSDGTYFNQRRKQWIKFAFDDSRQNLVNIFAEKSKEVLGLNKEKKERKSSLTPLEQVSCIEYISSADGWIYRYRFHNGMAEKFRYNWRTGKVEGSGSSTPYKLLEGEDKVFNIVDEGDLFEYVMNNFHQAIPDDIDRKLYRKILIELPMDVKILDMESVSQINTLKHIKDVLYFTYLPLYFYKNNTEIRNKKDFNKVDPLTILVTYRDFLEVQLKKYDGYSTGVDTSILLRDTLVPNLVLMRSVLEKHPYLKQAVCNQQTSLKALQEATNLGTDIGMLIAAAGTKIPGVQAVSYATLIVLGVTDIIIQSMRMHHRYTVYQDASNLSMAMANQERLDAFQYNNNLIEVLKDQYRQQVVYGSIRIAFEALVVLTSIKPVYGYARQTIKDISTAMIETHRSYLVALSELSGKGMSSSQLYIKRLCLKWQYIRQQLVNTRIFAPPPHGLVESTKYVMNSLALFRLGIPIDMKIFGEYAASLAMDGLFITLSIVHFLEPYNTSEIVGVLMFDIPFVFFRLLPAYVIIAADVSARIIPFVEPLIKSINGTYKEEMMSEVLLAHISKKDVLPIYRTKYDKYEREIYIDVPSQSEEDGSTVPSEHVYDKNLDMLVFDTDMDISQMKKIINNTNMEEFRKQEVELMRKIKLLETKGITIQDIEQYIKKMRDSLDAFSNNFDSNIASLKDCTEVQQNLIRQYLKNIIASYYCSLDILEAKLEKIKEGENQQFNSEESGELMNQNI